MCLMSHPNPFLILLHFALTLQGGMENILFQMFAGGMGGGGGGGMGGMPFPGGMGGMGGGGMPPGFGGGGFPGARRR